MPAAPRAPRRSHGARRRSGVTLVELLVTIAILAIIALMALPVVEIRVRMDKEREWGTVAAPGGGIMGVYSRSKAAPIRGAIKGAAGQMDPGAKHYSDWTFTYGPPGEAPGSGTKPE